MRKAAEIAEAALISTIRSIKAGMSEKQIAAELLIELYRHGSDQELPFAPIVSSGPTVPIRMPHPQRESWRMAT